MGYDSIQRMHSQYPSGLDNDSHRALVFFVENTVDYMLEQSAAAHQTIRNVRTALTVSFEQPTLMLAIASAALSHRAMTTAVHPGSLTRPTEPGKRSLALQYFGKAIERMKTDMRSAQNEHEVGPLLLGCMFFFIFEVRPAERSLHSRLMTTCISHITTTHTDFMYTDFSLCWAMTPMLLAICVWAETSLTHSTPIGAFRLITLFR